MELPELKGDWHTTKGKLKRQFTTLTDEDLLFEKGKQDDLLDRLQVKLGKTKEDIHRLISEL